MNGNAFPWLIICHHPFSLGEIAFSVGEECNCLLPYPLVCVSFLVCFLLHYLGFNNRLKYSENETPIDIGISLHKDIKIINRAIANYKKQSPSYMKIKS